MRRSMRGRKCDPSQVGTITRTYYIHSKLIGLRDAPIDKPHSFLLYVHRVLSSFLFAACMCACIVVP